MQASHRLVTAGFRSATFLLFVFLAFAAGGNAQPQRSPDKDTDKPHSGIQLYQQGDMKGALTALNLAVKRDKSDAEAWYYLGLTRLNINDPKNAKKALDEAVRLRPNFVPALTALSKALLFLGKVGEAEREAQRGLFIEPQNAEAHYTLGMIRLGKLSCTEAVDDAAAALKIEPRFALAYLLKSQALVCGSIENHFREVAGARRAAEQFKEAAEDVETFLQLEPNAENSSMWRDQLETLRVHAELAIKADSERTVFTLSEVGTPPLVLVKPEPQYTEAARNAQIVGSIRLRAVFADDGTVKHILVLRGLPNGLTAQAVKVAQRITFKPGTINDRPVSTFVILEYNFNLY